MKKLIVATLVACAPPLAFSVHPTFTVEERMGIAMAAAEWNARTVPSKQITLSGGSWRIDKVESTNGGYNGWCSRGKRVIQIDSDTQGVSTYAVALHEFGHAVGLEDLPTDHPGVMNDRHVTVVFSAYDMAECARVGACKNAPP